MIDLIVTANLSFIVFTFGSPLVAVQVAGGQHTLRIIATTLLRDNGIRQRGPVSFRAVLREPDSGSWAKLRCTSSRCFFAALRDQLRVFLFLIDHAADCCVR
jgi:hypothetical protein